MEKRPKKLSLNDIAKRLNISKSAVSFILNGKAREMRISDELAESVESLVKELGYKPNHLAQSLATGKTNTLGLIVENISDPFFGKVASLIEEEAYKNGYRIIYSSTKGETGKALSAIRMFSERKLDGYIIAPPPGVETEVAALLDEGIPVILFDRDLSGLKTDYVGIDNYEACYAACKHLVEGGFKNLAFVTLDSKQSQMKARLAGYLTLVEEQEAYPFLLRIPYNSPETETIQQIQEFIQANPAVDAICFSTNYLAVSGLEAIRNLGRSIPEDIGVVAFDDNQLFRLFSPPITAVAQPMEELSRNLIQVLLSRLGGQETAEIKRITVPAHLVIRQSSIKP